MSSRVTACVVLLLCASACSALEWGDFALRSDRSQDDMLIKVMNDSDLSTAISICAGVARRDDVFAGSFVGAIAGAHAGAGSLRSEILMRVLLEGLFDPSRASPALPSRLAANGTAIDLLLGSLESWHDPQLVAVLVRILPLLPSPSRLTALMDTGSRIIGYIRAAGGRLSPQESSLAMDYLRSVAAIASLDFLDQCVSLARLSSDPDLVKAARTTAASLAGS